MPADGEVAQGQARSIADADAHIAAERKLTFNGCPWYKRVIILSAGVIFNLLFAILVMSAVLMFVGTQSASTTVDVVSPNSAAEICGLESGDVLQVFDGQEVDSWADFQALIANKEPGDKVSIQVDRNGQIVSLGATLAASDNGKALLGVTPTVIKEPISVFEAVKTSVSFIGLVADFIVQLLNPATFNEIVGQSSSVIGVSFEAKNAAESGFLPFIFLAAGLSVSIGLMNLLPFPPLDGGRIVVETIERVTRKRIPVAIISAVTIVGLVALVALFLYVTGNDIQRYILGGIGHGG